MAVSSLSNFTVPLATESSNSTQGLLMPKLQYRFRVTMTNFGASTLSTELTKQVMMVDRPHPSFEEIKLDVYNSTVKLAGKHKFDDIKLKVRDDVNNEVSNLVGQQLQKQFDFFNQSSAFSGQDYKFFMTIEILDGGNGAAVGTLEAFQLQGCWIKTATYSSLDYSKYDPLDIELTVCFDNAYQTDAGGNLLGFGQAALRPGYQSAV